VSYRIGIGEDVHRLVKNRKLILGGAEIPFEAGLSGHSDADVLVHAVMDAIIGALGLGDIGVHFPDTDAKYKDAPSIGLLNETGKMLKQNGYEIVNIDSVIVAQNPRLSAYYGQMKANIAGALGTDINNVSVKATTEEGLGYTGDGSGMAARAVCLIKKTGH